MDNVIFLLHFYICLPSCLMLFVQGLMIKWCWKILLLSILYKKTLIATYLPTYFVCVAHCHPVRTFDAFIKVNTYTEHKSSNSSSWYRNKRGGRNKRRCFPFFFLSTYFEEWTPTADAVQLDICEIRLVKNFLQSVVSALKIQDWIVNSCMGLK